MMLTSDPITGLGRALFMLLSRSNFYTKKMTWRLTSTMTWRLRMRRRRRRNGLAKKATKP
jgi:hypothetical protein